MAWLWGLALNDLELKHFAFPTFSMITFIKSQCARFITCEPLLALLIAASQYIESHWVPMVFSLSFWPFTEPPNQSSHLCSICKGIRFSLKVHEKKGEPQGHLPPDSLLTSPSFRSVNWTFSQQSSKLGITSSSSCLCSAWTLPSSFVPC